MQRDPTPQSKGFVTCVLIKFPLQNISCSCSRAVAVSANHPANLATEGQGISSGTPWSGAIQNSGLFWMGMRSAIQPTRSAI